MTDRDRIVASESFTMNYIPGTPTRERFILTQMTKRNAHNHFHFRQEK